MAVVDDIDVFDDERSDRTRGPGGKIFGVVVDPRTYGAIFYMFLALPLGIAYFTFVTVGVSVSIPLLILIIGVVVALLFIALTRGLSIVEGYLTGALLGARIPHRGDVDDEMDVTDETDDDEEATSSDGNGLWAGIKRMITDVRTYTSMIYMGLMLPLGVTYFTVAVTGFVTSIAFMLAPFASLFTDHVHVMSVSDGDPEFLIQLSEFANSPLGLVAMAVLGFVMFFAMLHLARGIGWLHARFAEVMLVKRS